MITLTEAAAKHMQDSLHQRGKGLGIRIGVRTTGCSGYAYWIEYADAVLDGDLELNERGVTLLVSRKDLAFLYGLSVDWEKQTFEEGYKFSNPNEKGRCGCGESFTI